MCPFFCKVYPFFCKTWGSCTYYVITDRGGSLQTITVLHREGSWVPHTYFEKWFFRKPFRLIPWLLKRVLHLVWASYYVYIAVEVTLNMSKQPAWQFGEKNFFVKIFRVKFFGWKFGVRGWRVEGPDGRDGVNQGEVSTIRLGMLESSGLRKYSTLLVIRLFSRRLCLCHCLCICVPNSFLNCYYHKLSESVWVWGCGATRSEIWSGVTMAGQTIKQGKIELLSQWTMEGWDEQKNAPATWIVILLYMTPFS